MAIGISAVLPAAVVSAQDPLAVVERFAASDPKPFVIVEATGEGTVNRAQGVMISPQGHVLSAGHVAWIDQNKRFTDKFRISFRATGDGLPAGIIHHHKTTFNDREEMVFHEHYYDAEILQNGGSRFVGQGDLAVFRIKADGSFPKVEFFSKKKPELKSGETL